MKKIIFLCFLFFSKNVISAPIYLETFSVEDSVYSPGGWILEDSGSYLGVRFSVDNELFLSAIIANVGGRDEFFTAIVKLDGASGMPDVVPYDNLSGSLYEPNFNPSDLMFYSITSYTSITSSDTVVDANILLSSGYYAVIFGGAGSQIGYMPGTFDLEKSKIPLSDYLEYRSSDGWVEFDYSGIRVVLEGEVSPVPLPASFFLFLSGVMLLFKFSAGPDDDYKP